MRYGNRSCSCNNNNNHTNNDSNNSSKSNNQRNNINDNNNSGSQLPWCRHNSSLLQLHRRQPWSIVLVIGTVIWLTVMLRIMLLSSSSSSSSFFWNHHATSLSMQQQALHIEFAQTLVAKATKPPSTSQKLTRSVPPLTPQSQSQSHSRTTQLQAKNSTKLKLPTPVFVVGYPKSGTTSLHQFFTCAGVTTQHFCCCGDTSDHPPCASSKTMAVCILDNLAASTSGRNPDLKDRTLLQGCGDYDVYCQMDGERPIRRGRRKRYHGVLLDDGSLEWRDSLNKTDRAWLYRHFLPQHFYLQRLHEEYPNATYILPYRDAHKWATSVMNWFQMRGRVINEYMAFNRTLTRPGKEGAHEFLVRIYEEHLDFVRHFVQQHPSHALVEVNITNSDAGHHLSQAFGVDAACWGHHNPVGDRANAKQQRNNNLDPEGSVRNSSQAASGSIVWHIF